MEHVKSGIRIIQQHYTNNSQRENFSPLQQFVPAFARLERQLQELTADPSALIQHLVTKQEAAGYFDYCDTYPQPVPQFQDLNEAWMSLHQRWHRLLKWVGEMHQQWFNNMAHNPKLDARKARLAQDFHLWSLGLQELGAKLGARSPRETSIYALLECHVILADNVLETTSLPGERRWDHLDPCFRKIVEICRVVTKYEVANAAASADALPVQVLVQQRYAPEMGEAIWSKDPNCPLTFDLGVSMILLHVLNKCRDARIRYDAIKLLEDYPRLEGMWDSLVIAQVGRAIDLVERNGASLEEAAARGAFSAEIPMSQRVFSTQGQMNSAERSADLVLMKASGVGGTDTTCVHHTLTW
jgi:hypothetical protein